ncbi:MAG: response regulator transcription factor [Tannerellaceae bacterium]|nr:response regulator transcription factor [Tannerellaceae bacterium]
MFTIQNILIADDHELVIKGICEVLHKTFEIGNIVTLTNPVNLAEKMRACPFDLYILDLEFEHVSGFDLIEQIRKEQPGARILVVTMHDEIWNVNRLLQSDVNGIVLKRSSPDYLPKAVRTVMDNDTFLCPRFKEVAAGSSGYKNRQGVVKITPSEQRVLQYIVDGCTSRQIADAMCLTENTIEAHRKSLFLKLDARNVAHLVSLAIRRHLVK